MKAWLDVSAEGSVRGPEDEEDDSTAMEDDGYDLNDIDEDEVPGGDWDSWDPVTGD